MSKIFVVIGKSSTGKDTIYQKICSMNELGLRQVVGYTTRPIREGEENGVNYYFVNDEKLEFFIKEKKVIEHRAYHTAHGVWNYFTVNDEQINLESSNYLMIGTLESYIQIRNYYGSDVVIPIYIEVETGERIQRALNRERAQEHPKYVELCRRCIADEEDFSEQKIEEAGIQTRFVNDNLDACVERIHDFLLGNI